MAAQPFFVKCGFMFHVCFLKYYVFLSDVDSRSSDVVIKLKQKSRYDMVEGLTMVHNSCGNFDQIAAYK